VTRNGGASPGGLNSPLRVTHPLRKDVSPVCWGTPLGHQTRPPATADAFRNRFGGECLTHAPAKPSRGPRLTEEGRERR
jgi:hypothetical protein